MKICTKCKKEKDLILFAMVKGKYLSICKECMVVEKRNWYLNQPKPQRYCYSCGKKIGKNIKRCVKCKDRHNKNYLKKYYKIHREEIRLRKRIWRIKKLNNLTKQP